MQKRVMKGFPMKGMLMLVVVVMMAVLAEGEERTADCSKSCILQGKLYAGELQPIGEYILDITRLVEVQKS